MATFPTNIEWDASSRWTAELGINAIRMESGLDTTQTYVASTPKVWTIDLVHRRLTDALMNQVANFLRDNPKNFTLVDPRRGVSYVGSMVSEDRPWTLEGNGVLWRGNWTFNGQEIP